MLALADVERPQGVASESEVCSPSNFDGVVRRT
jgi:hypothetical protein